MAKLSAKGNGKELIRLIKQFEPDHTFTSGIKKTIVIFESGKILQKSQWETQQGKQDTGYKVYGRKLKPTFNLERIVNHFQSMGYSQ